MRPAEYSLREDERTRFEKEIFMPMVVIFSVAVLVLYATSSAVPGQFVGRPSLHISIWGSGAAALLLFAVWVLRWQRPSIYRITEDTLEVVLPVVTYTIALSDISEVVSIADRRAQPLAYAIIPGTARRAVAGVKVLARRILGGGSTQSPVAGEHYNFTTSDTGGARVICKNGCEALVSPMDLSGFLRHLETQFRERALPARVVREVAVQITSK